MTKFPYWVIPGALAGSAIPTCDDVVRKWYRMGIRSVVALLKEWEFAMEGWEFDEYVEVLSELGMRLLHVPVEDGYAPREEELHEIVMWIDEEINRGNPVLVHCYAGMGRSPTAIAAYLMYKRKLSADDALEEVGSINDELSITNEQYMALIAFEQYLKRGPRVY